MRGYTVVEIPTNDERERERSIMLIIPKYLLFKHATVNNVHYGSDREAFLA